MNAPEASAAPPEVPEGPALPADLDPRALDADARAELRSLGPTLSNAVAARLVAAGELVDADPRLALEHALVARRVAARIPAVREAVGIAAYLAGEWQLAIAELRTYHRLTGRQSHVALIADAERALGRPERAIDLYRAADTAQLDRADAVELLIVAAGARRDLGRDDAAVAMLQVRELSGPDDAPWAARLRYAYADALLATGRPDEAYEWFTRTVAADPDGTTDATERLLELEGVVLETDEADETDEFDDVDSTGADPVAAGDAGNPAADAEPVDPGDGDGTQTGAPGAADRPELS